MEQTPAQNQSVVETHYELQIPRKPVPHNNHQALSQNARATKKVQFISTTTAKRQADKPPAKSPKTKGRR
jgi:hypothetical protein